MPVTKAIPYLYFNGTAAKALELYKSALGATIGNVLRYDQMPAEFQSEQPESPDHVMNAEFQIGSAQFMCSDRLDAKPLGSSEVHITLYYDDADEMQKCFSRLAETGQVNVEIHDAFWGDKFGALRDEFGIAWQFIHPGQR